MKALSCLVIVACVAGFSGAVNAEDSARDVTGSPGPVSALTIESASDVTGGQPKVARESRALRRATRQLNAAMAQFRDLLDQPAEGGDVRVLAASR